MPHGTYTPLEAEPKLSCIEKCQAQYPASEGHAERRKLISNTPSCIPSLGPLTTGVGLPSGHSAIAEDPFLAQYTEDERVRETMERNRNNQINLQRQLLEQQRQAADQEAERRRNTVSLASRQRDDLRNHRAHIHHLYEGKKRDLSRDP
jgi:hypothetical protein